MSTTSSPSTAQSNPTVQEYSIRVPKNLQKRYHVMRFNATLSVQFEKWTQVKMERENNMKEYRGFMDEDQPKFGAGSEFGREAKEEARKKKLGIISRKYKADDQPWILKSCGSTVKKFKGIREGGVSENASYYVFTHAADGAIEAYPLHEWYKFQPIQRYKALSAEEAEQEFSKRNKHLNFFSLMLRKRLKGDDDADLDDGEEKVKKGKKTKELKISELDDWMDSSDEESEDDDQKKEDDEEKEEKKKKSKKKAATKTKKKKRDTDVEAFEDSDDGDDEGRELDYITDSSDSEPENTKLEGVSEEKALRKLLNSDEESENDSDKSEKEDKDKEDNGEEKDDEKEGGNGMDKEKKLKKNKKKKKNDTKEKKPDANSDFSSDSSTDEDIKKKKATNKKSKKDKEPEKDKDKDEKPFIKEEIKKETNSANSSRSASPINDLKHKLTDSMDAGPSQKKIKLESSNYIPGSSDTGINEDAVRKYLARKPMTTTELLQKFKTKKTGLSSEQLVNIMTQILKKINPVKQTVKGKMYLSIKS